MSRIAWHCLDTQDSNSDSNSAESIDSPSKLKSKLNPQPDAVRPINPPVQHVVSSFARVTDSESVACFAAPAPAPASPFFVYPVVRSQRWSTAPALVPALVPAPAPSFVAPVEPVSVHESVHDSVPKSVLDPLCIPAAPVQAVVWASNPRPVRTSSADAWPLGTTFVGASILPVCTDPRHDRLYVWIGKGRAILRWAEGSRRWSDFGGSTARCDADAAATAAREFWQETAGCLRFFDKDSTDVRTRYDDIAAALRAGEHLARIEMDVSASTESGSASKIQPARVWTTFVVQVPWDPAAAARFAHCRALLGGLHKASQKLPLQPLEAEALYPRNPALRQARERWLLAHPAVSWRMRALPRAFWEWLDKHTNTPTTTPTHKRLEVEADHKSKSKSKPQSKSSSDSASESEAEEAEAESELEFNRATDAVPITLLNRASASASLTLTAPKQESHGDAGADVSCWVPVVSAVDSEFLEKEAIELFSLPQLFHTQSHAGVLLTADGACESVKPSFLPTLAAALEFLNDTHGLHCGAAANVFPAVCFG